MAWLTAVLLALVGADPVTPRAGLVIERSCKIAPGTYRIPAGEDGAIVIRGSDIVVDFTGVTLVGSKAGDLPDQFTGTAIRVDGGKNIQIHGLTARGYQVGILARGCSNLTIESCDLSYNWRQRLKSTIEREDLSDWMSFHQNEKDEWLRYGAGIYLSDCQNAKVTDCTITGGQCGLMMTRCDGGEFSGNDFSFNSGVGIGMYRSSKNRVLRNRLDWNVRGHSEGVYNRGQDSAAILVYEQSCENTFALNSATHSGDGFFLWAGQSTMDTGKGGCNDNIIESNDFSFAPTNGIEVTFSRNVIRNNMLRGCWHGIWGGYSYDTVIEDNTFVDNVEGIAIEHGQDNVILNNLFVGGKIGIRLWQNEKQDPNWGYPKHRDTRSRDYRIEGNGFFDVPKSLDVKRTLNVVDDAAQQQPAPVLPGPARDRSYILMTEWGPYDFRSPLLWPREKLPDGRQRFEVLGPPGTWRMLRKDGVARMSAERGTVPGEVFVSLEPGKVVNVGLQLEYVGEETTSTFGEVSKAGTRVPFGYKMFAAPIEWNVTWFEWDESSDPRTHLDAFQKVLAGSPLKAVKTDQLAYAWSGAPGKEVPADHFATVAEGTIDLPDNTYKIELTSDDGVRCWIDDKLIIDNWTWHVPTTDSAVIRLEGKHRIRIEHFEIDGYATLKFDLKPQINADERR